MTPDNAISPAGATPAGRRRALRAIAIFEAAKGLAALAAGIGLLELLHHDIHRLALALLWRFHLDPALPALPYLAGEAAAAGADAVAAVAAAAGA